MSICDSWQLKCILTFELLVEEVVEEPVRIPTPTPVEEPPEEEEELSKPPETVSSAWTEPRAPVSSKMGYQI